MNILVLKRKLQWTTQHKSAGMGRTDVEISTGSPWAKPGEEMDIMDKIFGHITNDNRLSRTLLEI
jgi:hypothetical protein